VLDFYADWCISCKVMERNVFTDPDVERALAHYALLRSDVTANDASDKALLERLDLPGPPGLVFFDASGRELSRFRIEGEKDKAEFLAHLERLAAQAQAVAAR
jgi:thiol:disulfide interchange protein DsbD